MFILNLTRKKDISSLPRNFPYCLRSALLCSSNIAALHCAANRSVNDTRARAVTICQEVFEWTVYLPFGNDDTIWALLTVFLAPDLPLRENPLVRCLAAPYGHALPPFPPPLAVLLSRPMRRLALSSVLFFHARFFFFFGSTTVPLAARESPLTRRMDDLRISSRSLSLVRSRYRRRSSASTILSFSRSRRSSFFFPAASTVSTSQRAHRLFLSQTASLSFV